MVLYFSCLLSVSILVLKYLYNFLYSYNVGFPFKIDRYENTTQNSHHVQCMI